jgi:hypothetical protein
METGACFLQRPKLLSYLIRSTKRHVVFRTDIYLFAKFVQPPLELQVVAEPRIHLSEGDLLTCCGNPRMHPPQDGAFNYSQQAAAKYTSTLKSEHNLAHAITRHNIPHLSTKAAFKEKSSLDILFTY